MSATPATFYGRGQMIMAGKRMNGEGSIYQRKSDGRWFGAVVVTDEDGNPKRKTVREDEGCGGRQAQGMLREIELLEAEGLPRADKTVTVSQLLERWHKVIVATRPRDYLGQLPILIDGHIVPFVLPGGRKLGSKRVGSLTFDDVDALLDAKREAGLAPSTRRLIRSVLVQALNQAVKWRIVSQNEAAMSTPVPITRGRSHDDRHASKAFHEGFEGTADGSLFMLMLMTGVRRGEALGLRWEDVDLKKGVISIRQQLQRINGQLKATEVKTERSRRSIQLAEIDGPRVEGTEGHSAEGSIGIGGVAGHGLRVHQWRWNPPGSPKRCPAIPDGMQQGRNRQVAPARTSTHCGVPNAGGRCPTPSGFGHPRPCLYPHH